MSGRPKGRDDLNQERKEQVESRSAISRTLSWPRESQANKLGDWIGRQGTAALTQLRDLRSQFTFGVLASVLSFFGAARSSRRRATSMHASAVDRSSFVQLAESFPTVPRMRSPTMTGRASTAAIAASTCATVRSCARVAAWRRCLRVRARYLCSCRFASRPPMSEVRSCA